MTSLRPDDLVWHVSYGRGLIDALVAGRRARVRFDAARDLPRTVLLAELRAADVRALETSTAARPVQLVAVGDDAPAKRVRAKRSTPAAPRDHGDAREPATEAAPPPPPSLSPRETADLRQALEAMRLGVVPSRHVEDYTVGRSVELASIADLLRSGQGLRAVWGAYGAGKTHFLDVVESKARELGYATARIVLDPLEVPPTHPKRLYAAVLRALRLPGGADEGIEPLALRLCESASHTEANGARSSRFFSPYLRSLRSASAGEVDARVLLRDYAVGEPTDRDAVRAASRAVGWRGPEPFAMPDYRTYGRMYVHLLGTLASYVADAGHRGLLLLFDEVEYIDALDAAQRGYAIEVIKHIAAVTLPSSKLGFDPDDARGMYAGGVEAHRQIPLRFCERQPLAAVFALTPLDDVRAAYASIVHDKTLGIELRPFLASNVRKLLQMVEAMYRRAYPAFAWRSGERTRMHEAVLGAADDDASTVRRLVQRTVCAMDAERLRRADAVATRVGS